MSTYCNRLQRALQSLLQYVAWFFHPRSSCMTLQQNKMHSASADVFRGRKSLVKPIPVVMLATVVATTATLSSNSCKTANFLTHLTSVLRKQFAVNDTFLREANSYKRALALRNSRLVFQRNIMSMIYCV